MPNDASHLDDVGSVVEALSELGLELVSRLNPAGDVTATIDNPRVAATRLRLDAPCSAYFYNAATGLRGR